MSIIITLRRQDHCGQQHSLRLSVDEGMENDYQGLLKRYQKAQPRYRNTTNISFLKEARFKQQRKLNPQIEKYDLGAYES